MVSKSDITDLPRLPLPPYSAYAICITYHGSQLTILQTRGIHRILTPYTIVIQHSTLHVRILRYEHVS